MSEGGVAGGHTQGGVAAGGEHRVWPGVPCIVTTLAVTQHMQGRYLGKIQSQSQGQGQGRKETVWQFRGCHNHNQCWRCYAVSGRDFVAR